MRAGADAQKVRWLLHLKVAEEHIRHRVIVMLAAVDQDLPDGQTPRCQVFHGRKDLHVVRPRNNQEGARFHHEEIGWKWKGRKSRFLGKKAWKRRRLIRNATRASEKQRPKHDRIKRVSVSVTGLLGILSSVTCLSRDYFLCIWLN